MQTHSELRSALHSRAAALHHIVGLLRGDQIPVIADGVAQRGVSCCKINDLLLRMALQEAPDQGGGKAVTAAHTVIDLDIVVLAGDIITVRQLFRHAEVTSRSEVPTQITLGYFSMTFWATPR